MTQSSYLRYPHLRDGLVTFAADDDVWIADIPAPGASARASRITSDRLPVSRPRISPDGTRVAWTGQRDGAPEAYVMGLDSGTVTRLTYFGDDRTAVRDWLSDDEVAVVGRAARGHGRHSCAFAVPAAGGVQRLLPFGLVQDLDVHGPAGAVLLLRGLVRDPAACKGYRGGRAGKLWLDPDGSGEFHRFLADLDGNISQPMWVGNRVAFLSDHEGCSELYSCLADATDLRRHSHDPGEYYARNAATDGTRIVFQRAGRLWLVESLDGSAGAEPRLLDIRLTGSRTGQEPFPIYAPGYLGAVSPDLTGRASAVEVRGTIHWLTHKSGPARTLMDVPGVRGRLPVVLGDTGLAAWVTDAEGDDALEIGAVDGTAAARRLLAGQLGRVQELVASPDGHQLAVVTDDKRLLLVDVQTGMPRVVASGEFNAGGGADTFAEGPAFSPDSAWLAWTQRTLVKRVWQIRMADVATLGAVDVTEARFQDWNPAFTADGKHLAFLSARTFDPHDEQHVFDLAFVPGTRPYLVPLAETEPSPFAPRLDGDPATAGASGASASSAAPPGRTAGEEDGPDAATRPADAEHPATVVDLEGIAGRVVPFPVPAGDYRGLAAVRGGMVWLAGAANGVLGDSRAAEDSPERMSLRRYDFAKKECTVLVDALDSCAVSGDGARLVVRDGGKVRVRSAERSDGGDGGDTAVDLERIRVTIDPLAERRQSYREAWRLLRDNFWRVDMNGIDWAAMQRKYEHLVDVAGSHDDFADVLWELHGELRTSHAYVNPPSIPGSAALRLGLLGADLARDEAGVWRIAAILPGESSVPAARSPLLAPGVAARVGDAILAVDGVAVPAVAGPYALLAGKAGKPVELTLQRAATPGGGDGDGADGADSAETAEPASRRVVVIPTSDEMPLRYQAWIAGNRARVAELSDGRLGYIHLPDQTEWGWAEFHRDLHSQIAKEGLVVDTRGNRGGYTSELVLQKLTRRRLGWAYSRTSLPESYPVESPRGPVVSVCDEFTGSDGDIINQALKEHGHTVVGVRTWGGVIGIDGRYCLVDGTGVTQPKYALTFDSVGLGLENHGCEPTVEVHQAPQDLVAGRDPQLAAAVRIALDALAEAPADVAPALPGGALGG